MRRLILGCAMVGLLAGCDDAAGDSDVALSTSGVALDDPRIVAWAVDWSRPVAWGTDVDSEWRVPEQGVGPATGEPAAVVSLGNGGVMTLVFDPPLADGPGDDLAIYENGFNSTFLELAFVEVSSDGERFVRFVSAYRGTEPVAAFGAHDADLIHGLAGRHQRGIGTPFDLAALYDLPAVVSGEVDLQAIRYVRLIDIVGDGSTLDSTGNPIYDPTPSEGTGGFDLDGVAVLRAP